MKAYAKLLLSQILLRYVADDLENTSLTAGVQAKEVNLTRAGLVRSSQSTKGTFSRCEHFILFSGRFGEDDQQTVLGIILMNK